MFRDLLIVSLLAVAVSSVFLHGQCRSTTCRGESIDDALFKIKQVNHSIANGTMTMKNGRLDHQSFQGIPDYQLLPYLSLHLLNKYPDSFAGMRVGLRQLKPAERNVYSLSVLTDEYLNGGICQYFDNAKELWIFAPNALKEIGEPQLALKLTNAHQMLAPDKRAELPEFGELGREQFRNKVVNYIRLHESELLD